MYILEKSTLIYSVWKHLQREKLLSSKQVEKAEYYKEFCSKEQHVQMIFFTMLHQHDSSERVKNLLMALGMDGEFEMGKNRLLYNSKALEFTKEVPKGNLKQQRAFLVLEKSFQTQEALLYFKEFQKHLDTMYQAHSFIKQKDVLHWLAKEIQKNPLKRICKVLHVSQKALAEYIHVSEVTVNRWAGNEDAIPAQSLRMFDILEENEILKAKQKKTNELIKALIDIQKSY